MSLATLSRIEAYLSSPGNLVVTLPDRSVDVAYQVVDGNVVIDKTQFDELVGSEDVSLSQSERVELVEYLEELARQEKERN